MCTTSHLNLVSVIHYDVYSKSMLFLKLVRIFIFDCLFEVSGNVIDHSDVCPVGSLFIGTAVGRQKTHNKKR